ncbi:MAG: hypothetical protein GY797_04595 [Deltaproteobacteria bacterium]|nr:hypothetical protein [Deltaproteobacteria bacterium]
MNINIILSILSFSLSIGGIVPAIFLKNRKKEVVLAIIFSTLFVTTGVALFNHYQHERLIKNVQNEIVRTLSTRTMTFDQIFIELHYKSFSSVNEALFRAVDKGRIRHKMVDFQKDGSIVPVKGYFIGSVSTQ